MPDKLKNFNTISQASGPFLYREKKSKFLGYAFPVSTAEGADRERIRLKKQYPDASHVCYAYRIGSEKTLLRMNDDGEPAYTAGSPILGQITSYELFDVLVCVVRYYGGVKLGAGGLSKAYKEAAKGVLEISPVIHRKLVSVIELQFQYTDLDEVMSFISQNRLTILTQKMELECTIELTVSPEISEVWCERLQYIGSVQIQTKEKYL